MCSVLFCSLWSSRFYFYTWSSQKAGKQWTLSFTYEKITHRLNTVLIAFPAAVTKFSDKKQLTGEEMILVHYSKVASSMARKIRWQEWEAHCCFRQEAWENESVCSQLPLVYTVQDPSPGNGTAHFQDAVLHINYLIKIIPHRLGQRPVF